MNITLATKNISETINGFGVIVALHGNNEKWLASFEEDRQHNIILDAPIKVMHILGENKVLTSSRSKEQITNELVKNKFRRLPITDPGSEKLLGIVTSMDILDFLGGGDKYKILEEKHQDNVPAAINEPVKMIMTLYFA